MSLTKLSIYTLPNPDKDGISSEDVPSGAMYRLINGRLQADISGVARRWTLRWSLLTQNERNQVRQAWRATLFNGAASLLTLPDGTEAYVWPRMDAWSEMQVYDVNDAPRYNVVAAFDEASYED